MPQRRLFRLVDLLGVRHEPVEVDIGVDLAELRAVEVRRVHLEHLHQQGRGILDEEFELHRLIGREVGDTVTVRTPKGQREYEILAVEFKEL